MRRKRERSVREREKVAVEKGERREREKATVEGFEKRTRTKTNKQ
jgi:hypothetical protein